MVDFDVAQRHSWSFDSLVWFREGSQDFLSVLDDIRSSDLLSSSGGRSVALDALCVAASVFSFDFVFFAMPVRRRPLVLQPPRPKCPKPQVCSYVFAYVGQRVFQLL